MLSEFKIRRLQNIKKNVKRINDKLNKNPNHIFLKPRKNKKAAIKPVMDLQLESSKIHTPIERTQYNFELIKEITNKTEDATIKNVITIINLTSTLPKKKKKFVLDMLKKEKTTTITEIIKKLKIIVNYELTKRYHETTIKKN